MLPPTTEKMYQPFVKGKFLQYFWYNGIWTQRPTKKEGQYTEYLWLNTGYDAEEGFECNRYDGDIGGVYLDATFFHDGSNVLIYFADKIRCLSSKKTIMLKVYIRNH